jgi:hypothetical protein
MFLIIAIALVVASMAGVVAAHSDRVGLSKKALIFVIVTSVVAIQLTFMWADL